MLKHCTTVDHQLQCGDLPILVQVCHNHHGTELPLRVQVCHHQPPKAYCCLGGSHTHPPSLPLVQSVSPHSGVSSVPGCTSCFTVSFCVADIAGCVGSPTCGSLVNIEWLRRKTFCVAGGQGVGGFSKQILHKCGCMIVSPCGLVCN